MFEVKRITVAGSGEIVARKVTAEFLEYSRKRGQRKMRRGPRT